MNSEHGLSRARVSSQSFLGGETLLNVYLNVIATRDNIVSVMDEEMVFLFASRPLPPTCEEPTKSRLFYSVFEQFKKQISITHSVGSNDSLDDNLDFQADYKESAIVHHSQLGEIFIPKPLVDILVEGEEPFDLIPPFGIRTIPASILSRSWSLGGPEAQAHYTIDKIFNWENLKERMYPSLECTRFNKNV